MQKNIFHLGLCMAGSISAGAYTAGVIDYLLEALENWERAKASDETFPDHDVVIDLLCGSSGGGITAAMTQFALKDSLTHLKLAADGTTYSKPENNILWDSWVELSRGDVFDQLLATGDIKNYDVSSLLNTSFIDKIADNFERYVVKLSQQSNDLQPEYFGEAMELFLTLFNVTGINYELFSKAATGSSAGNQCISDHRDIAHFRWSENAEEDGRMHITLKSLSHLPTVIEAAKATGAFPIGLKARTVTRKAKFIWDNPFFNRDKEFGVSSISLGKDRNDEKITKPDQLYTSLNADGGTANNEPIEVAKRIMLTMRLNHYKDIFLSKPFGEMNLTEKKEANSLLKNSSIILVDPFPSSDNSIIRPVERSEYLIKYSKSLIGAMRSQLLFDAKEALDAYKKGNYGLHIISPSKENFEWDKAIACGSLGGFGGFLDREFRVHDFFLGRHNCQSFLRKYFVVDPNDTENRDCIDAVIKGYENRPAAKKRFTIVDESNKEWLPVIPDFSLPAPMGITASGGSLSYVEQNKLPIYKLSKLQPDFLEPYRDRISNRFLILSNNFFKGSFFLSLIIKAGTWFTRKKVIDGLIQYIKEDLQKRKLIK
jgi:hypothetical protein